MKPKNDLEEKFCRALDFTITTIRETSQGLRRNMACLLRSYADRLEREANEDEEKWNVELLKREGIMFKDGVFQPCPRR